MFNPFKIFSNKTSEYLEETGSAMNPESGMINKSITDPITEPTDVENLVGDTSSGRPEAEAKIIDFSKPVIDWQFDLQELKDFYDESNVDNASTEAIVHPTCSTLKDLHEAIVAYFRAGKPIFLRWTPDMDGDIKRGFSRHRFLPNVTEPGLSVEQLSDKKEQGVYQVTDRVTLGYDLLVKLNYDLKNYSGVSGVAESVLYLLEGEINGRGTGGEPTLDAETIKIVSRVGESAINEARFLSSAGASVNNRESFMTFRKYDLEKAYAGGEDIPQKVLDELPEIEANEILKRQREEGIKTRNTPWSARRAIEEALQEKAKAQLAKDSEDIKDIRKDVRNIDESTAASEIVGSNQE
mgnify:CR=1 FL=1